MLKEIFDKRYPVTNTLVMVTTVVFLAMQILRLGQAQSAQVVYEFGGMLGVALRAQPWELWRFVSPIFVHIGFEHYIMNTLTLYFLGRQLEELFGRVNFALLYLLAGVMGNIFVFIFTPNTVAAGASTSLFGMFAVLAVLRKFVYSSYIQALGQQYLMLLVLNLLGGFFNPGISMAGHFGGALGGALCAFLLPLRAQTTIPMKKRLIALAIYLALTFTATLVSLFK